MYVVTPCGLIDGYKRFGEKHAVSIFRAEMVEVEDGDSTRFPQTLVSTYVSIRRHNPEEQH